MFKSKAKVDQQASLILSKVQDDNEKRLRGYQLGNLYYQAREYEQAKKYVSMFLAVKEQYAPAHKLMAQILERSSAPEDIKKSIGYYKRSFELDDSQKQFTLKICALLLRIDIAPAQASTAMYWIEQAKTFYPTDPTVFSLQEKMIQQALSINPGDVHGDSISSTAMEELLVTNLKSRPFDICVRLKLLKCLERAQKFDLALDYIREVLMKSPYNDNFDWYNYTAELLKFVTKGNSELAWSIYLLHNFGAARTAVKARAEKVAVDALQRLDQVLHSSLDQMSPLVVSIRAELKAHLLLLSANLLVRRNADPPCISALYVAAFNVAADSARYRGDDGREVVDIIEELRAHRFTQAGYLVLDRAPSTDQVNWLRKISRKFFSKDGKATLYSAIFGAADIDNSRASSMLMTDTSLEQLQPVLPDNNELVKSCSVAQLLFSDSLHHQSWLVLRLPDNCLQDYLLELTPRLNFSPHRLGQCEADSLSQMDLAVFLLHTAYASKSKLHEHHGGDNYLKVSDLSPSLCSEMQAQWWSAVYDSCVHNTVSVSVLRFGRQRQLLSRGLQVIRLIDNHGMSVQMVCHVAQLLQAKLEESKVQFAATHSKVIHLTYWVKQYWEEAVRLLTILQSNGTLAQPREKLFMSYDEELEAESIQRLLAQGRLWLALQLFEDDQEDEALQELRELPQPLASFTAARIYQTKADNFMDADDAREMYLLRSQESLHLTVDRLSGDVSNPLNADVEQALEKIENELDGHSPSFVSASESASHNTFGNGSLVSTPRQAGSTRTPNMRFASSARGTPVLSMTDLSSNVHRVRPSPERLELQVRSLASAQESLRTTIHEERNMAAESGKQMVDTVTDILERRWAQVVDHNKKINEDLHAIRNSLQDIKLSQQQIQSDVSGMKAKLSAPVQQSTPVQPSVQSTSEAQVNLLQQQLAALTALMATSLQHSTIRPTAASLSGYGSPSRVTPPVYHAGLDTMQLGTYPHVQQPQTTTPSRGQAALTQQEEHAAALAAAEHGYDGREYYVDDGENYYADEYPETDYYGDVSAGYVGAEGCNTIAYMPKTSASGKPMPQPGFFAQPDKSQTKLAEPQPSEQGVPPNVVMNKEMMDKEAAKQKPAEANQSPLVVNVPKPTPITIIAPTTPTTPITASQGKTVPPSPAKSDSGSQHDSSFDPHFEPIIELPPEVTVVTGEEEEVVLFECRAKLFRMSNMEWKDRGIGPVKVLERKDTAGKCRLLMRRDQVHKICLNHAIHQAMTLAPMGDKGIAWIWSATDYSEQEPTTESFAIRFKTPDIAEDFKKAVELAKKKGSEIESKGASGSTSSSADKPATADKPAAADKPPAGDKPSAADKTAAAKSTSNGPKTNSLSELFKPTTNKWQCDGCYLFHEETVIKCSCCAKMKPGHSESISTTSNATTTAAPVGFGTFSISNTGTLFGDTSTNKTQQGGLFGSSTTAPLTSSTSLFGSKPAVSSQPIGLFGGVGKASTTESTEEGSLLRQLLSADSSTKPASKPAEAFSMGGFSFNAPPKTDTKKEPASSEAKPATSKPSLFAGFGGFNVATATATSGFTFAAPSTSSKASLFQFTSTTASDGQALTPSKSDMKQSISAPQLGTPTKPVVTPTSKDDSSLMSPTKPAEEECNAEFTPVIELPDIVEVKTGEEDEEKMFGERCKLFRMCDQQWKERGIGELRILRREATGACRLVMRRDQVFKLCANHSLVSGMKLAPSGDKAWMWGAEDFSENELKRETLCARFKTPEIAQQFEKAFNDAVSGAKLQPQSDKEDNSKTPQESSSKPSAASLSELFKSKPGDWICSGCAVKNTVDVTKCLCCGTSQPGTEPDEASQQESAAPCVGFGPFKLPTPSTDRKPVDTSKPPAAGGFTLSGFTFGGTVSGGEKAITPTKGSAPIPESPGKYVEEDGEGDHIHFEPVIDLPDLIDVKTGEEDEIELYVHRAKLYRFTNGEYKERGLGDVKLLKHKTTDKVRIILRREKVLKLACNHMITTDMELRAMENSGGKAWIWYALDFSEESGVEELFAIRFKTVEIADEFKTCFDAAKKGEEVPEQKLKTVTPQKNRSRASSESHSRTPAKTATTTPASVFGNMNICSPANPKNQSSANNIFGGTPTGQSAAANLFSSAPTAQSNATPVFGGTPTIKSNITQGETTKTSAKALFAMFAKSDNVQGDDNQQSTPEISKSKIPIVSCKSTPVAATSPFGNMSKEQTPSSGKSMIPVVDSKATPSGGQSLLAQPKINSSLFTPKTSTPQTGSLFGQLSGQTSTSPSSLFGAKPTSQSLFGGAGAKSPAQSVFGGSAANGSLFGNKSSGSKDSDVEFVCENKPSEELVRKAREFLFPAGYYMYEERKNCRGCIGCEKHEDAILDHLFHNKSYNKQPGLSLVSRSTKSTTAKPVESTEEVVGFAGLSNATDFSSLSTANNPNAFQKTEGFKWSGAGKTLFGGTNQGTKDVEDPEAYEAETEFKPVLDVLPELIQVRTGEEDEERVFSHRGKLYRFDVPTKQWKERGVGEMKLLKHQQNGTVRVLLRREQVHKLVCNHLVQPDIELLPMATSETAWCWFAKDYSDNNSADPPIEQFAVRFKNIELAKEFKQKFEDSKEFVRQAQETKATKAKEAPASAAPANTAPANTAPANTAPASTAPGLERRVSQVEDGDDDDDEEEDSDDDSEDDIRVMFERQVTLLEKQGSQYQAIGIRTLQVVEENIDIIGGIAIYALHEDNMEYRQLIFQETSLPTIQKNLCFWNMYDFLSERPHLKYFQAVFASQPAAEEFAKCITQGIAYAKAMQLKEGEAIHTAMATNPIELDLSQATAGQSPK